MPSPRAAPALLLLLAALAAAGCLAAPSAARAACDVDAAAPGARAGEERVPVWRRGDAWNYTVFDAAGTEVGFVRVAVAGCERVDGELAYVLSQHDQRYVDHDHDGTLRPHERDVRYAVADLNEVWDVCGEPFIMGDCKGRYPRWDFPLEDGRKWSAPCCGDVIMTHHFEARRVADAELPEAAGGRGEAWLVTERREDETKPQTTWIYAPGLGLFVERVGSDGNGGERWVLADFARAE